MTKEVLVWKSYGYYTSEELDDMKKNEREYLEEFSEVTDEELDNAVWDSINISFEDEQRLLSKRLEGRVLAIADLGLWNGRRTGYKILGDDLSGILSCGIGCDEVQVYADRYNVYAKGYHHDGTNFVEFRELREDRNYDNLLCKLYNQEPVSRQMVNYYTKSLRPYLKEIYGV